MAGPGGKEVGRVSIRVTPNTEDFRKELLAQLKGVEKSLEVKIPAKVDGAKAVQEARVLHRRIENVLDDVDIRVDLDLNRTETALGNIVAYVDRMQRRMKSASDSMKASTRSATDLVRRTVDLKAHWQGLGGIIRRVPRAVNQIRMDGLYKNTVRTSEAVLRLGDRFRNLSRRVVRAGGTMRRALSLIGRVNNDTSDSIKKTGDAAQYAGRTFLGLTRIGWIIVAVFIAAAPLIALVGSLLAGIPSLLAAGGAAAAAIGLGFKGISEAIEVLKPQVDSLRKSLSQTFKEGLTPVFEQLRDVFPVLETGLNKVAKGLIPLAQAFTDVVTSAVGMDQIANILENSGRLFERLAPMVRDFTSGFLTLAEGASKHFGTLAQLLNDFAFEWNALANRLTKGNVLGEAMRGLSQVLGSLLSLFLRLIEAGVHAMGVLGGPLAVFVNGFGDAVIALMPALTSLSSLVATVLGEAMKALVPIIEALTPAFQMLSDMLGTLLVGAIRALTPLLTAVAENLGGLILAALKALEPVLPIVVDFLTQLGTVLSEYIVSATKEATPLFQLLADLFGQILASLLPLLPSIISLAQVITTTFLQAIKDLLPQLIPLAQQVFPMVVEQVRFFVDVLLQAIPVIAEIIAAVIPFVATIVEALIPAFQAMIDLAREVWPEVSGLVRAAMDIIVGIIRLATAILRGDWSAAWDAIKQILSGALHLIWNAIVLALNNVKALFWDLPGGILRALGNLGGLLWDAGVSLIQGLINGIMNKVGEAYNAVKRAVGRIRDLFPFSPAKDGPFSGKGYTTWSGRALVLDWAKGIYEATPQAVRAIERMMDLTHASANSQWEGHLSSDSFGSISDKVAEALAGWGIQIDQNGIAKLVRTATQRRNRRL